MKMIVALFALLLSTQAHAYEGSWFGLGGSFEHLANGVNQNGVGANIEGGYWYLGNVAYGGYAKSSFMGNVNGPGSKLNIYDLGVFWKAATESGLYGKLTAGLAFVSPTGNYSGTRLGNVTSFSIGLAGGFLFQLSDSVNFGPEVTYRHLTAGSGADQIGGGLLLTFNL
jgi:hypothetical protein